MRSKLQHNTKKERGERCSLFGLARFLIGTVATHFQFSAFGDIISGDTSLTRCLFTSREFDVDTGLQYHRARWYDANVGRWISEDPLGFAAGDVNTVRYMGNGVAKTDGRRPNEFESDCKSLCQVFAITF